MAKLHLTITTYNRSCMLQALLDDVQRNRGRHQLQIDVFNDGSSEDYSFLDGLPHVRHHKRAQNGGKERYWRLVNRAFDTIRTASADYYFVLPDDVRLCLSFFDRAIETFEAITDRKKICLNLLLDKERERKSCWTHFPPRRRRFGEHSVYITQWVDMCLIAQREFFEELDFRLEPISRHRWNYNRRLSSGVGQQISQRLHHRGLHLYQVSRTLMHHEAHDSQMNREERRKQPLTTRPLDRVIARMTTMPSRQNVLPRAVDSLLPQIDELQVYLNGYTDIPECLQHAKILPCLGEQHRGDLGDAGKFYGGRQEGYHFTVDDDICYPPDYVATLIDKIEVYDRRACVGVHGAILAHRVKSYCRDRTLCHCTFPLEQDRAVHILGTGTLAYHSDLLRIDLAQFPVPNMADIWFGLLAQRQKLPLIAVARQRGWIELLNVQESIYERLRKADQLPTALVNSLPQWHLWGTSLIHE